MAVISSSRSCSKGPRCQRHTACRSSRRRRRENFSTQRLYWSSCLARATSSASRWSMICCLWRFSRSRRVENSSQYLSRILASCPCVCMRYLKDTIWTPLIFSSCCSNCSCAAATTWRSCVSTPRKNICSRAARSIRSSSAYICCRSKACEESSVRALYTAWMARACVVNSSQMPMCTRSCWSAMFWYSSRKSRFRRVTLARKRFACSASSFFCRLASSFCRFSSASVSAFRLASAAC
mmetsp:Transcript_95526/g.164749  ORF Transcript_95526/g.164749 Transcript_95526/m.164749 type:complete len:238 (+) Transcript_95526:585-1298(+)